MLAEFGDPRPGVGVSNGVPDIVWTEISGGQLTLEDRNYVVEIKPFRMAKYPVTNMQFSAFLHAVDGYSHQQWWRGIDHRNQIDHPKWPEPNAPREMVSWFGAVAFCRWFSEMTDTRIRLPTEWEWQQAATGGDPKRKYPWKGSWDSRLCNSDESQLCRTIAVGMYPRGATQQGLMDMVGNVWEWCSNHDENPREGEATHPEGHSDDRRVICGGSWSTDPKFVHVSYRIRVNASYRFDNLGFRLVQDIP